MTSLFVVRPFIVNEAKSHCVVPSLKCKEAYLSWNHNTKKTEQRWFKWNLKTWPWRFLPYFAKRVAFAEKLWKRRCVHVCDKSPFPRPLSDGSPLAHRMKVYFTCSWHQLKNWMRPLRCDIAFKLKTFPQSSLRTKSPSESTNMPCISVALGLML